MRQTQSFTLRTNEGKINLLQLVKIFLRERFRYFQTFPICVNLSDLDQKIIGDLVLLRVEVITRKPDEVRFLILYSHLVASVPRSINYYF